MVDPDASESPYGDAGSTHAPIRTFLIADIRGYTLFTQQRGDEAAAALAGKFADIARGGVETRGGTLLELRGDEALCVFSSTRNAIRAAIDLQQRFVEETLAQPELPLTVGIGLDAGEAIPVQGGYRGGALNLAARLCGQARAGEILASGEVTHLARRIEGVRYEDRGTVSLKGLADPVAIVGIVPEGEDPVERLRPFAPAPPSGPKKLRRWAVAVVVALVLSLAGVSIALLWPRGHGTAAVGTNSIAHLNAADGSLELAALLGQRPGASAIGFGSLWVAEPDRGVVARLDLEDGSVTDTIRVGLSPAGVAVGEGSVWVTNSGEGSVSRIDVATNEVSQTLEAGTAPTGIAFGGGALWVADSIGGALLRVDPASGENAALALPGLPSSVAFTADGVWVSIAPNSVVRVDPKGPTVVFTKPVGNGPTGVVAAFGSIWVANQLDGTLSRLEPSTGREEAKIPVGEAPDALVDAAGSMWVADEFENTVAAIDPGTNTIARTVPVGATVASLATEGEGLWLAVGASATDHRGGTLTVSSAADAPVSLDPAVAYDDVGLQILSITGDGLLAYKKIGGPDGASLVPDLAAALPDVSADGLTYRFPLRAGMRYSTGEPVRPEDFRRAIERALVLHPAADLLGAIAGADACAKDPSRCDLSDSVVTEDGSVTFHLARQDPELPFKLALPFAFPAPAGTPTEDQGMKPLPATGPYMVGRAGPDGIELVRNPTFQEWSGAAQPDGFVDAISWRFREDVANAFGRLSAGQLDVMMDAPRPQDLATLRAAHPGQIVSWPGPFTLFVGFDVLKPPFDDVRVRQALNDALDRRHVVDLLGGSSVQRLTCQVLPPNFQGYVPFCPYTLDPGSGVWTAPNLDRARALIREAGAAGKQVTALVTDAGLPAGLPTGAMQTMEYVVGVLDSLGLEATLEVEHDGQAYFDAIYPPTPAGGPGHPNVYMSGWISDYPGAGNWIGPQFSCEPIGSGNSSGWCSRTLDAQIDAALRLDTTDPGAASRAWTEIEHRLVDDAAQAPLTNPVITQAVSARTENVQLHPRWEILLSRLWVQ